MHAPLSNLPIAFEQVSLIANGVTVLDHIELLLEPGAPTVLIGPNGSGKTTLLKAAMGLIAPSSGRITWGGQGIGRPERRALVFQRPTMLRRSAIANVRYALQAAGIPRTQHEARIAELLGLVGLEAVSDRPARRLSGGEQQRLALARALARDPNVLFLDEPTASLDPAATKAFEDVVRSLVSQGIKVVMATHDLGAAKRLAGEVVLLHRGRVIEACPAQAFFDGPNTDEAARFVAGDLLV
jgi:tungstate transport system ATP-binding protein